MTDLDAVPDVGSHLGRFVFLREIAQGPLGPLYELRGEKDAGGLSGLGRVIRLASEIHPDAEQTIASAAWDSLELRHARALCVADVAFGSGWVTLVHDYQEGSLLRSLRRRAHERESTFPVAIALRVALDFIEALQSHRRACESAGIPWTPGGIGTGSLYLCGDGQIRLLDGQVMFTLIRNRNKLDLGNLPCSAPEVLNSNEMVDERADVFAVGVVLWELLTGLELSEAMNAQPIPSARQAPKLALSVRADNSKLSPELVRAVDAALEPKPTRRPATLTSLKSALTRHSDVATYAQVIDFTDALLNRESTLFRLTLDPAPKLSDELGNMRSLAPHQEWTLEMAKRARLHGPSNLGGVSRPQSTSAKSSSSASVSRRVAPALMPPKQQSSSARQTLIGLNPGRAGLSEANGATFTAAAVAPQMTAQNAPQSEPTSQVLHVVPKTEPHIPSDSSALAKAVEESLSVSIAAGSVTTDGPSRPIESGIEQLVSDSVAVEAARGQTLPEPLTLASFVDGTDTGGATEKDPAKVVRLTPLAISAWLFASIGVTVIATLSLQKIITREPSLSVPSSAIPSQAPSEANPPAASTAAALTSAQRGVTVDAGALPPERAAASDDTPATPVANEASAPSAPPVASRTSTGAGAQAVAKRIPASPKQMPRKKKRGYIPHGL